MNRTCFRLTVATLVTLMMVVPAGLWAADAVKTAPAAMAAPPLKTQAPIKAPGALKIEGQAPARTTVPGAKKIPSTMRLQPDLVITNVKITPVNPSQYDTITFSADVTNKGVVVAPASTVAVFIGGETYPVTFAQPAIGPNVTKVVVREFQLKRVGGYSVKFVADAEGVVAESNEGNNVATKNFSVRKGVPTGAAVGAVTEQALQNPAGGLQRIPQIAFQIAEEQMLSYSFPGHSNFVFYLRPTKAVDTATVEESAIQVHLKYFNNGALQDEETLTGHFASKGPTLMRWESDQTPYGGNCTSSATCHCEIYLTLQDSVMSQDGEQLDGNKDGQPGGDYQHMFHRGMYNP